MDFPVKNHFVEKHCLTVACVLAMFMTPSSASPALPEPLKTRHSAVYHAARGQALDTTLNQIAQRSGISFKLNADIGKEQVSQAIAADNWTNAVKSLLENYNYTAIQDGDTFKTVIITGSKNGSGQFHGKQSYSANDSILIAPKAKTLPPKYRSFPAGSVTEANLPIAALMNLKNKTTTILDLPMGQFNLAHDYTNREADGSKTWVGYLADEGQGYRVYFSQGDGGLMGIVTTPDGAYSLESDAEGNTYLIDTKQLQHAGYEGDSATQTEAALGAVALNAAQSEIEQLQAAADAAKIALDNAKAALASINDAYTAALRGKRSGNTDLTPLSNQLNAAKLAADKALANYNQVLSALNNSKAAASGAPASVAGVNASTTVATGGTPVVDLMVLYTTEGQSAAYAKQRINLLVTASNQAYSDSNINMKLRLVYTEPTAYIENNSNPQALDDLAYGRGVFADIGQKRVQYGADLVFLFRPLHAQTAGSCGTTYVEFANGSPANKSLGYGSISDGNARDSDGYYCAINTFTHEIGHSMGLVHDRENSSFPGVFNYAYAWGLEGVFATIMSYKQPMLMYFSTPALANQCAGQPCGYAEADRDRSSDQAAAVNYTAPIVADFMATTVAAPILN